MKKSSMIGLLFLLAPGAFAALSRPEAPLPSRVEVKDYYYPGKGTKIAKYDRFYWVAEPQWAEPTMKRLDDGSWRLTRWSSNMPMVNVRRLGFPVGGCLWKYGYIIQSMKVRNPDDADFGSEIKRWVDPESPSEDIDYKLDCKDFDKVVDVRSSEPLEGASPASAGPEDEAPAESAAPQAPEPTAAEPAKTAPAAATAPSTGPLSAEKIAAMTPAEKSARLVALLAEMQSLQAKLNADIAAVQEKKIPYKEQMRQLTDLQAAFRVRKLALVDEISALNK